MIEKDIPILIVGGGGHSLVVMEACEFAGYHPMGILDEAIPAGSIVGGVSVLGGDDLMTSVFEKGVRSACVAVGGNLPLRKFLTDKLLGIGYRIPSLVHCACYLSRTASVDWGSVLLPGCIVNAGAIIGKCTTLNSGCIVEHECRVGNYSHIAPKAVLLGSSCVGELTLIGSGATILPGVTIGSGCIVGAGSVVLRDVPDGAVVVGNPARDLLRGIEYE
ncbi:MAG: acetyltransferase [Raoultibacter sp.]